MASSNGSFHEDIGHSIRRRVSGEIDITTLVIPRDEIERFDLDPVLSQLVKLLRVDRGNIRNFQGWLSLSIDGYNDDKRELFEVPEVCQYLEALSDKFPYWFYFLSLDTQILHVIAFCVSGAEFDSRTDGTVYVTVDPEKLSLFKMKQFSGLNRLFETFDLDSSFPTLNRQISDQVNRYFEARESGWR